MVQVITRDSYLLGNQLGRGGNAAVYFGEYPIGERHVAVKVLTDTVSPVFAKEFLNEVALLSSLQHPNLVRLFAVSLDDAPCMLLELMYCSLDDLLHRGEDVALSWRQRAVLCRDTAEALRFLHAHNVLHRDIKGKNVLVAFVGDSPRAKLADFGLSRQMDYAGRGMTAQHCAGTVEYMAPELHDNRPCTRESDVYALGLLLFEVGQRCELWVGQEFSVFGVISRDMRPLYQHPSLPQLPAYFDDLMVRCWDADPKRRPSMDEVLRVMEAHWLDLPEGLDPESAEEAQYLSLDQAIQLYEEQQQQQVNQEEEEEDENHEEEEEDENQNDDNHPSTSTSTLPIPSMDVARSVGCISQYLSPQQLDQIWDDSRREQQPRLSFDLAANRSIADLYIDRSTLPLDPPTIEITPSSSSSSSSSTSSTSTSSTSSSQNETDLVPLPFFLPLSSSSSSSPDLPAPRLDGWEEGPTCHRCLALFGSGIFYPRRHHCRCCARSHCHACSSTFLHLDRSSGPHRVCLSCLSDIEKCPLRLATALQAPLASPPLSRAEEPRLGTGIVLSYVDVQASNAQGAQGGISFVIQHCGLLRKGLPRVVVLNPDDEGRVVPVAVCQDLISANRFKKLCVIWTAQYQEQHPDATPLQLYQMFSSL